MDNFILNSDDEVARYVTNLSGWVDRHGEYWGVHESQVRYNGCTHVACSKCGAIRDRRGYCSPCHEARQVEKFNALEKIKWDGVSGGILDSPYNQLAGCVHDAIYKLFQTEELPNTKKNLLISHRLFRDIWVSIAKRADLTPARRRLEIFKAHRAYAGLYVFGAHFSEKDFLAKPKKAP